jgi:predicted  nucleic acid-binding Zn-ribbon protein
MTNEQVLQETLSNTLQRIGKKTVEYESEIANLSAQVIILTSQINELNEKSKEKTAKSKPLDN